MSHNNNHNLVCALEIVKQHLPKFEMYTGYLEEACKKLDDPQVLEDYQKIDQSLNKLDSLLHDSFTEVFHRPEANPDFWSHMRHEMRASVGGIKGYTELISDVFLDRSLKNASQIIDDILGLVEGVLPAIDQMRVDVVEESAKAEGYASCYIGESVGGGGKILIIDDSQEKHDLIKRRLTNTPYVIISALSGSQAFDLIPTENPDLIILDLIMPQMSGFEVLNALKLNVDTRDIPVLIISSLNEIDSVVQCLRAGAEDYLSMPLNPVILLTRVNSCLNKKLMRDREKNYVNELDKSRLRLEKAIHSIDEGFVIFDAHECMTMCNDNFFKMYEGTKNLEDHFNYESFLRNNMHNKVYAYEKRKDQSSIEFVFYQQEEAWIEAKVSLFRQESSSHLECLSSGRWIEVITNRIQGGGIVCVHKDVTNRILHEKAIIHQADHDPLTGLANRAYFMKELTHSLEQAEKKSTTLSVMFFDLDGFKNINDTLGHEFGDHVLKSVAKSLSHSLRSEDFVARLGGDEFCAIIKNNIQEDGLKILAQRCLQAIGHEIIRGDQKADFGISIGIAIYPYHGKTPKEVLKRADQAMYEAKRAGKGRYIMAS